MNGSLDECTECTNRTFFATLSNSSWQQRIPLWFALNRTSQKVETPLSRTVLEDHAQGTSVTTLMRMNLHGSVPGVKEQQLCCKIYSQTRKKKYQLTFHPLLEAESWKRGERKPRAYSFSSPPAPATKGSTTTKNQVPSPDAPSSSFFLSLSPLVFFHPSSLHLGSKQ